MFYKIFFKKPPKHPFNTRFDLYDGEKRVVSRAFGNRLKKEGGMVMATCPKCNGELFSLGNGEWQCGMCGKKFVKKKKSAPTVADTQAQSPKAKQKEEKANAGHSAESAAVADTYPVQDAQQPEESNGDEMPPAETAASDGEPIAQDGSEPSGGEEEETTAEDVTAEHAPTEERKALCPNCGVPLIPIEHDYWRCDSCGKGYLLRRKSKPAEERAAEEEQVTVGDHEEEIAALKRRIAQLERTEKANREEFDRHVEETTRATFVEWAGAHKGSIFVMLLLVIAFVTLCTCFMGLRGIYVNVDDPNEFFSFTATSYEWQYDSFGESVTDKGTWNKNGNTLTLKYNDEWFGDVEDSYMLWQASWDGFTLVDSFGGTEKRFERVSLINYNDNISTATVRFDANGGSGDAEIDIRLGRYPYAPADAVHANAVFAGWYTTPEGDGELFDSSERCWKDVTYYARWELFDVSSDGTLIGLVDGAVAPSNLIIPDGVTSIGNSAFSGCSNIIRVVIPDSVTSIGDSAFDYCDELTFVTIGNGVTSIGRMAFSNCRDLTSIVIPDSVTSIGGTAFGRSSLSSIIIPNSVTSIGGYVFSGCRLTSVTFEGTIDEWNAISKDNWWRESRVVEVVCSDGTVQV